MNTAYSVMKAESPYDICNKWAFLQLSMLILVLLKPLTSLTWSVKPSIIICFKYLHSKMIYSFISYFWLVFWAKSVCLSVCLSIYVLYSCLDQTQLWKLISDLCLFFFRWGHQPKEMQAASLPPTYVMKCIGTQRTTAAQVRRLVVNH